MTTPVIDNTTTHADRTGAPVRPSAVAWIDAETATVARIDVRGTISTCVVERGWLPALTYLAVVAGAIGDRERVVILGPSDERLALEREYAAIYQRPERLVDVEPAGAVDEAALVARLRRLVA
jgi:hypothetical protein